MLTAAIEIEPSHRSLGLPRQYEPGTSLTFAPSSTIPTGSLQWLHDDQSIPAATRSSLTLANLTAADSGNYRLRVTHANGMVEYSDTEVLNVLPFPPSPIDRSFSSKLPSGASVAAIGPFASDGSMIVRYTLNGETFTTRLAANGRQVDRFQFPSSAGAVLAGFPEGALLVSQSPYRLDREGDARPLALPAGFDPAKPLTAAAVAPDGKIYLAQESHLARLLADGSPDPEFTFAHPLETGISALQFDNSGRVYVYGRRTDPDPSHIPSSWTTFYRLLPNGSPDATFAVQVAEPLLRGQLHVTPLHDGRLLYYTAFHGYRLWKLLDDRGVENPSWTGTTDFSEEYERLLVDPVRRHIYLLPPNGRLLRYLITDSGLALDHSFYLGTTFHYGMRRVLSPDGQSILLSARFDQWDGHPTSAIARLSTQIPRPALPPNVLVDTRSIPAKGGTLELAAAISGDGPVSLQWLALDGQPLPATSNAPELNIPGFDASHLGRYQLRVNVPNGVSVLSNVVDVRPLRPPFLAALSGRATSGPGDETPIAGLTVHAVGALPVPTLLRGVGPTLESLGVTGFLRNPAITLFDAKGTVLANNDQWLDSAEVASAGALVGAFPLGAGSSDAALFRSFHRGNATLHLISQDNQRGVGLLEIYRTPDSHVVGDLLNLSFRAHTSPGEGTAILGFVITDPEGFGRSMRVLLRAVGPSLAAQGVSNALPNPVLTVFDGKAQTVAQNDDWATTDSAATAALSAAMKAVGAFELAADSRDSALLLDLPAGVYTIHATGGTGVVLLEIYTVR